MHLIYIDDSKDGSFYTFSAIAIHEDSWDGVFEAIRNYRKQIRDSDGIYIRKELHAWKFVSGRGNIADRIVTKWRRCEIFKEVLTLLVRQNGLNIFNVALDREDWAFERLLNRINRTMESWRSRAILICDEGKEQEYTKLVRKMSVYNPIPSMFGAWESGNQTKNIPLMKIIEDPFFKKSNRSNFIQLADFCAYSLLRKERPIPSKTKYGIDQAFYLLEPICVKVANYSDPYGIIR